jgi:hypothetical protein
MSVQKTPLASIKNTANGVAGLDAQARVTSPIRGRVSILDYGGDPTGTTPCDDALRDAIEVNLTGSGYYVSGPEVDFPPGNFRFADEINLKNAVCLSAAGSGMAGGQPTRLIFPADSRGIIVNRYNTFSTGVEAVPTTGADGSIIEGFEIVGAGTNTAAHGISLRARAVVRNTVISGFGGNGLNIVAAAGFAETEPQSEGNANNWRVDTVRCQGNGEWGMFVDGPDANAGLCLGLDCSANGSGGLYDSAMLSNAYISAHTDANGAAVSGKNQARNRTSLVWHLGARYSAAHGASPAQLVATEPGTNEGVWEFQILAATATASHPQWLPNQPEGRYFVSYPYRADNLNAGHVFFCCYEEGGYSKSRFVLPNMVIGGSMGQVYGGAAIQATLRGLQISAPLFLAIAELSNELKLQAAGDHPTGLSGFVFNPASGDWITRHAGLDARVAARYTTDLSTFTGGRSAAVGAGHVRFPRGAFIGDRFVDYGTAPPASGSSARGDVRFNTNAAIGQPQGWQCVTGGVNGSTAVWAAMPPLVAL